jgi:hypothetical protein
MPKPEKQKSYLVLSEFVDGYTNIRYVPHLSNKTFFIPHDDQQAKRLMDARCLAPVKDKLSKNDPDPNIEEPEIEIDPYILHRGGGYYDVIGIDGTAINGEGKLKKRYAEGMLKEYLAGNYKPKKND